jgi:hypothetical protein
MNSLKVQGKGCPVKYTDKGLEKENEELRKIIGRLL